MKIDDFIKIGYEYSENYPYVNRIALDRPNSPRLIIEAENDYWYVAILHTVQGKDYIEFNDIKGHYRMMVLIPDGYRGELY